MCRGSHLDLKVASKDNKWFRNAALKQDSIVIETRAAMIGADMLMNIIINRIVKQQFFTTLKSFL